MFDPKHGLHITHGPDENWLEKGRTNRHMPDAGVSGCGSERK
jgi:hypothetical protein